MIHDYLCIEESILSRMS